MGTVFIRDTFAAALQVKLYDVIYLQIDGPTFLRTLWNNTVRNSSKSEIGSRSTVHFNNVSTHKMEWITVTIFIPFNVSMIFHGSQGKFSDYSTKVMIAEYQDFLSYLLLHIHPLIPQQGKEIGECSWNFRVVANKKLHRVKFFVCNNTKIP